MKFPTHGNAHTVLVLALVGAICVLAIFLAWANLQPKGRVSCLDFSSYNDALRAYSAGATWLDRDGDGIPCEALYAHDNPGQHGE